MPYETQGTEAIRAIITLRKCWFEQEEIYLNQGCLHCGSAATYLLYFTNRKIQQLLLNFIERYNCNPTLNFDFLDLHDFALQYDQLLSELERLVIHYSFGQTQQPRQQCFEAIDSIFERPYAGLCHIA
ncbi:MULTISPECIES: hypothetical protein [unclassified Acinetobacter]|uniref:hypothetical protein n=1 Tax=unclassified Acinetobacter TaxID=196816 RepID=UPI0029350EC9|nr:MULTISPECIES: hypothetical protein [unclassified Acinetobacter]WOE30993.1 hypothetical protein QSG84_11645 [Acinetobacter sp. SAAs470]WOE39189.1 hypothetical protein QSG86_05310 [Acinetobacter sp. SAAs474]